MGIPYILAGLIFFSNPFFRMLDYLPDFIGCILIIIGTSKLSCIDGRIESARKYTMYYAFVSALKVPLSLYLFTGAKDYLLPATFMFSVLEGILMIGIFVSLIGGFQYLLSRQDCGEKNLAETENVSIVCFIFAIARAVVSFIPELLGLGAQKDNFDYTFTPTAEQNMAMLKPYAEILAFAILLIFGIYYAFMSVRLFIHISGNREFIQALRDRYTAYETQNTDTVNYRKVRFSLLLFFFAVLLWFNQILDFVNIIPNTPAYIFMIAGSIYMIAKLGCVKLRATLPVYIPLTVLSVYNNITQTKVLSGTSIEFIYDKMLIKKVPEILQGTEQLPKLMFPVIIEYILFAVLVISICKSFDNLGFLRDRDTVSIYEILFAICTGAYFVSCVYIYFGQFIRTAHTFVTQNLSVYIKYDSILSLFEWVSMISFMALLYFAYRYGTDILSRVKALKEDTEY